MELTRLYSRRSATRSYTIADYDPQTRVLHVLEEWSYGQRLTPPSTTKIHYDGADEPWEGASGVTLVDADGGAISTPLDLPAPWARSDGTGDPPPGYGSVPSAQERELDLVFGALGLEEEDTLPDEEEIR